jgi:hypothetical protein
MSWRAPEAGARSPSHREIALWQTPGKFMAAPERILAQPRKKRVLFAGAGERKRKKKKPGICAGVASHASTTEKLAN